MDTGKAGWGGGWERMMYRSGAGKARLGAPDANATNARGFMTANMTTQRTGSESPDIVKVLRTLMVENYLPFWSQEGWDSAAGGFAERLDINGKADPTAPRRIRVQARQIYCFAQPA